MAGNVRRLRQRRRLRKYVNVEHQRLFGKLGTEEFTTKREALESKIGPELLLQAPVRD